jgi:hypothetical protein
MDCTEIEAYLCAFIAQSSNYSRSNASGTASDDGGFSF